MKRTKKTYLLAPTLFLIFIVLFCFGIMYTPLVSAIRGVKESDIEVQSLDLGKVPLSTKITKSFTIINNCFWPVDLTPPKSSCGCLVIEQPESLCLKPYEKRSFSIEFKSPTMPKSFEQPVLFKALNNPSIKWKASIHGQAVSNLWAEPFSFNLKRLSSGKEVQATGVIHFEKGVSIKKIIPVSSSVFIEEVSRNDHSISFHVKILQSAGPSGTAYASVIDVNDKSLLYIPIHWRSQNDAFFIPKKLLLPKVHQTSYRVLLIKDKSSRLVKIQSLHPNVEVKQDKEKDSDKVIVLHIILKDDFPLRSFSTPFIEATVSIDNKEQKVVLFGVRE